MGFWAESVVSVPMAFCASCGDIFSRKPCCWPLHPQRQVLRAGLRVFQQAGGPSPTTVPWTALPEWRPRLRSLHTPSGEEPMFRNI